MRHGIVCSLAVALLCACQPGARASGPLANSEARADSRSTAPPLLTQQPSKPMTLRELSKVVGATCENPDTGEGCSGGDYDVELHPDCSIHGLFARVIAAKGALLIDKAPPEDTVRRAMLSQGQLVCIQAIARAGTSASYYYVVAMSGETQGYGNRKIVWFEPHQPQPCQAAPTGLFEGGCAAGWADGDDLLVVPTPVTHQ